MFSPSTRVSALSILAGIALCACDGTGGPVLVPDTGPHDRDAGMPDATLPDGGTPDETAPTIVSTDPDDGTGGVGATSTIAITFSERMAAVGTITATADGTAITLGDATWDATGTTVTVTPAAPLASESRVRVIVGDDFSDVAGNSLALSYTFTFDVADTEAPTVTGSDPAQGANGISARTDAITITFSELMDSSVGTTTLTGGAGAIGAATWVDGVTLRVELVGLAYASTYHVGLDGFIDASGNALDETVYLVDGAIVLETGPDDDAPRVEDSVPAEGQVNVALRGTPTAPIVFDEPMDTSAGVATLRVDGIASVLTGTWSAGGTVYTANTSGRLRPDTAHAIVLEGFRDVAGNALDTIAYLGDGEIDFDTGADATLPTVLFSTPSEGSTDAEHRLGEIRVAFDRGMDATATTTLRVDDGVAPFDADVTWNLAGTIATIDTRARIHSGRRYSVDLRGVRDAAGDAIDPLHGYLADGILDFTARAPRGEQCRDELSVTEATGTTAAGGYEWTIAPSSVALLDGGATSCRYSGGSPSSQSPDAVVRYAKTTAAGSAGGTYLHISIDSRGVGDRVSFAVYRDVCSGALPGGTDARQLCMWDRYRWEAYLDVGPGEYFVWSSYVGHRTFEGLTVRIEEVPGVPDGESCANPYDTSSSIYTAPSAPGGEHVWAIPYDASHSVDVEDAFPGPGVAVCDGDEDQAQGPDAVVEIVKARSDSLVTVLIEPTDEPSTLLEYNMTVELTASCDPRSGATLACTSGLKTGTATLQGPRMLTVEAPAGPLYLWVAPIEVDGRLTGTTLRVREIDDAPGSSCANAIPLAPGANPISPASPTRLGVPSCMENGALAQGVTWYRLTAAQAATAFRTDVAATSPTSTAVPGIAIVDAASERELGCSTDARQIPLTAFATVGSDVCVAVRNGSGIGRLDVASVPYEGVLGVPTNLGISRPVNPATGAEWNIASDLWLVATPTTLYMGVSSGTTATAINGVLNAPKGGMGAAQFTTLMHTQIGNGGASVGEAVFTIDDAATGTAPRLYRLVTPAGAWAPTPWDAGFAWPARAFDALSYDGTSLLVSNDHSSTVPVAIRSFSPTSATAPTSLGSVGANARDILAVAADSTWIYFAGGWVVGSSTVRGIYRVRRSELGTAVPELIAAVPLPTLRVAMSIDSTTTARHLYVRASTGDVHVIAALDTTPAYLGSLSTLGTTSDFAMTYDPASDAIFLFETESNSAGTIVRLD